VSAIAQYPAVKGATVLPGALRLNRLRRLRPESGLSTCTALIATFLACSFVRGGDSRDGADEQVEDKVLGLEVTNVMV